MEKLTIPPEFSTYAEEKGIFTLLESMLQELIVARPDEPLQFLDEYLSRDKDKTPRVIVYGPPCSGKYSLSKLIARKLRIVHVVPKRVLQEDTSSAGDEARSLIESGKDVTPALWAKMIHSRMQKADCLDKGWVLEGFPRSRKQALALQTIGVMPMHFIHLECSNAVLTERYEGKRVDSITGDVYHVVFNPPSSEEVASRLEEEPGGAQVNLLNPLQHYLRHTDSLLPCYQHVRKSFNADQPIEDLFSQVYRFLCSGKRSVAPYTPRVLLLGPCGSGKRVQAMQLEDRYGLVNIECRKLIRQTLASGSAMASHIQPFIEEDMMIPDDMALQIILTRLTCADCITKGWVLHGFPLTRLQAELLAKSGHTPNRVFFLNISEESIKERLTHRRTDPITGEMYHLLMKPPSNQAVLDRLKIHPRDTEDQVMEKLDFYNMHTEELKHYYEWGQDVNADQDPLTVFEVIESMLVNPIPKH